MNIYRNPTDRNRKLQGIKKKTSGDPEKVYMTARNQKKKQWNQYDQ